MAELVPFNNPRTELIQHQPLNTGIPEGYPEIEPEGRGFREYLAIVRRHLLLFSSIVVVALGVSLYFILTAPPRYRGVSVIRLADARRAMTGGAGSEVSDVLGRETDVLLSQIQILQSRQLARTVVAREGLQLLPVANQPFIRQLQGVQVSDSATADSLAVTFDIDGFSVNDTRTTVNAAYGARVEIGGIQMTFTSKPEVRAAAFKVIPADVAMQDLLDNFRATPRPKTDIIDLTYVTGEPHRAQQIANAMALNFQAYSGQVAQAQSKRRRIFLEEQLKQTDVLLREAMNTYSSFRSGQQVFSSREMASAQQSGIVNVELRRAELDAQKRTYQSLLGQAQKSPGSDGALRSLVSAPGIAANPVIQQLYTQLSIYESQRDSLTTGGAAQSNPDVVGLNTLISSTSSRIMSAVRSQIAQLDASIAALDNLKTRSSAEIARLPGTETQEAQLSQQVQTFQKITDQLQGELQKAKMSEAVETGQVQIVDLADVPSQPMPAGRTRKLALGLLLGLLIGFGAASVVDGMNTAIRGRDDVERGLNVPGLAVIPQFMPSTGSPRALLPSSLKKRQNGHRRTKSGIGAEELVTITAAQSSSAEAYRTLRTNLIFSQSVQVLRTLVVTSASPGEGKTTTAANLAVSFAQQGLRVVIADCDLRRARLHRVFGVPREPGLTELVVGRETQETTIQAAEVPGLYVIPSGVLPPNPAELLGGERMRRTLSELCEAFDLVILDSPPLLAASDAAILSTMTDGTVLVVRAGVTELEAAQQAVQQLKAVGARIVGAVLNDPDSKLPKYGSYYRYEYAAGES
jgi:capsular exopolysaccharide synthesis family protein